LASRGGSILASGEGLAEEVGRAVDDGAGLVDGEGLDVRAGVVRRAGVDEEDLDHLGELAGLVLGDAAAEAVDEVVAVGLDHHRLAGAGSGEEEVADLALEAGVELRFGLLEEQPGIGRAFQAHDEDGEKLADAEADVGQVNRLCSGGGRADGGGGRDCLERFDSEVRGDLHPAEPVVEGVEQGGIA